MKAKQQLCTCTTLFCTFLCRQLHEYPDYPWKCLISRFVKNVNKQWQNSFSSWTWIWLIEIQLQRSSLAFDKVSELEYTLFFFIRTSNFDAEAERSYIFWRFEAETFLKMFLNLPGIVLRLTTLIIHRTLYHLMTLMVSKSFWNNYE